jgi:hypothetical protein
MMGFRNVHRLFRYGRSARKPRRAAQAASAALCLALLMPLLPGAAPHGTPIAVAAEQKRRPPSPKAAVKPPPDEQAAPASLLPAARFGYMPSFAPAPSGLPYASFPCFINPLVTQTYPATPEYTYLYVPSPVPETPPSAANRRYRADNASLMAPLSASRQLPEAYSWRKSWLSQTMAMRRAGRTSRAVDQPSIGRAAGQKIDNTLRPDAFRPEGSILAPGSLGDLRLPGTPLR